MAVTESIFYLGKPYEGKPHVRFDEGSRKTGFNICTASLSYSTIFPLVPIAGNEKKKH